MFSGFYASVFGFASMWSNHVFFARHFFIFFSIGFSKLFDGFARCFVVFFSSSVCVFFCLKCFVMFCSCRV